MPEITTTIFSDIQPIGEDGQYHFLSELYLQHGKN